MRVYVPFGTQWYPVPDAATGRAARQHRIHPRQRDPGGRITQIDPELTLGGYMKRHERASAFGGSDGHAYSVAIWVDDEPDEKGRYGAALLFVRWNPGGDAPAGHVESGPLAWGKTPAEAEERLKSLLPLRREGGARCRHRRAAGGMVSSQSGLVLEREGGTFRVATDGGRSDGRARGKAKRSRYDRVVVGDRVTLDEGDEQGTLGHLRGGAAPKPAGAADSVRPQQPAGRGQPRPGVRGCLGGESAADSPAHRPALRHRRSQRDPGGPGHQQVGAGLGGRAGGPLPARGL